MSDTSRARLGSFSPRGLIITGLVLHALSVCVPIVFQHAFISLMSLRYVSHSHPAIALVVCAALAASIVFLVIAWRRQTYAWSGAFLLYCLLLLPWPFSWLLF